MKKKHFFFAHSLIAKNGSKGLIGNCTAGQSESRRLEEIKPWGRCQEVPRSVRGRQNLVNYSPSTTHRHSPRKEYRAKPITSKVHFVSARKGSNIQLQNPIDLEIKSTWPTGRAVLVGLLHPHVDVVHMQQVQVPAQTGCHTALQNYFIVYVTLWLYEGRSWSINR